MRSRSSSKNSVPRWALEALEKFKRNGFVVIKRAVSRAMCEELLEGCKKVGKACRASHPKGNRGEGRWSFSFGGECMSRPEWFSLLKSPIITQLLRVLYPNGGVLVAAGGDFCIPKMSEYQMLHSDICIKKQFDVPFPCPFMAMNVAVQPCGYENGSIRALPGTHTCRNYHCPEVEDELLASKMSRVLMDTGDVLFRDVRTIHGGTPNEDRNDVSRYLPSLEFCSNEFRASNRGDIWPIKRVVPQHWARELIPEMLPFLEDVILK